MYQRQDSRRFCRSPKILNSPSQQNNIQGYNRSKQFMSPVVRNRNDSEDDCYARESNINKIEPYSLNLIERVCYLERSFQQQKIQRLNEHNKVIKMIKQMQCKHNSIIYDSQIKYQKTLFKPELLDTFNFKQLKKQPQSSLRKVSSQIFDRKIINQIKQSPQQVKNEIKNGKGPEINDKTYLSTNKKTQNQNPQKLQIKAVQSTNTNQFMKQANFDIFSKQIIQEIEKNIITGFTKKITILEEQISTNFNIKISELNKQLILHQQNLFNHIGASVHTQNQLSAKISNLTQQFKEHKNSQSEISQVFTLSNNVKSIQCQNSSIFTQLEQIGYKMQQLYTIFNDIQNTIGQKFSNQTMKLEQIYEKIEQSRIMSESDLMRTDKKMLDIENYWILKYQLIEKQINKINQIIQVKNKQLVIQKQKRQENDKKIVYIKQQIRNDNQEKMLKCMQDLRDSATRVYHNFNIKLEAQLATIIKIHISQVQGYLAQLSQKQNYLFSKFINPKQPSSPNCSNISNMTSSSTYSPPQINPNCPTSPLASSFSLSSSQIQLLITNHYQQLDRIINKGNKIQLQLKEVKSVLNQVILKIKNI